MLYTENANKTAIITADSTYKYSDIFEHGGNYAEVARKNKASKIAIFAQNSPEWIFAFYGGWHANCTIVPIDFLASKEDLLHILNDCKPELLLFDDITKEKVEDAHPEIPENVVVKDIKTVKNT